jgi:hypothetical protein
LADEAEHARENGVLGMKQSCFGSMNQSLNRNEAWRREKGEGTEIDLTFPGGPRRRAGGEVERGKVEPGASSQESWRRGGARESGAGRCTYSQRNTRLRLRLRQVTPMSPAQLRRRLIDPHSTVIVSCSSLINSVC